jgi:hypothetical protein
MIVRGLNDFVPDTTGEEPEKLQAEKDAAHKGFKEGGTMFDGNMPDVNRRVRQRFYSFILYHGLILDARMAGVKIINVAAAFERALSYLLVSFDHIGDH